MADFFDKTTGAVLVLACLLTACSSKPAVPLDETQPVVAVRTPEQLRINDLERQLAEKQRQCAEDKRRQDAALKDNQKKNEELQKKLDALLAIDRDLRARSKGR